MIDINKNIKEIFHFNNNNIIRIEYNNNGYILIIGS